MSAQCPLYPHNRTFLRVTGMSALCQKRTRRDSKRHVRIASALPPESGLMSKHRSVSLFGNLAEGGRARTGLRFGAIYLRSALCCLPVRELVEVPIARRIEPYCNRVIGARGS